MLKKILFIVLILFIGTAFSIPERIIKKADKEIAKFFETEKFSKEACKIPSDANEFTPSAFGDDNLFKIYSEGKLLGYGYIGNAPSKTATFDYLVLFDPNFIITRSKVLLYHEEYGGEIGSKRWLEQFQGLDVNSEIVYGESVIPISGATISGQSMTRAINDLLVSIKFLQLSKLL